ncbi:MAG: energy transducer TonB [Desulfobulbaceae bacterium]|jgi:protein TonB|nr:energy transducer TonB [Desulfobulbaceae bacterium]
MLASARRASFNSSGLARLFTALVVALLANLLLFGLMPFLLTGAPSRPAFEPVATNINIVRVKPPPPVEEKKKPEEPPPKRETPKLGQPRATLNKLTLPFAVNPRIPQMSQDLAVPVAASALPTTVTGVFDDGDLDAPLTTIVRLPPMYPMAAKNRGLEGWVKVRLLVNEEGRVEDVEVLDAAPKKIFDEAVLRAVHGWRFKAGTVGGQPVKTRAETTVRFNLD